ncbi:hypothetical protein BISU_3031 [Bifidobacterium subtile]|uniref:Uncharacterized protein n=1 Tax=Bifidobacterium subtile TaxID=77635 RepID=A0A087EBC8_9BIFI|nr:hypothetical protein BISU_3031 [Bifidobacterium subtile]
MPRPGAAPFKASNLLISASVRWKSSSALSRMCSREVALGSGSNLHIVIA